jgi:hypothetical protein
MRPLPLRFPSPPAAPSAISSAMLQCNASRFRAVTRLNQPRVVDVQVSDWLVHPDRPHLLADARHLEHLVGQKHLGIVPTRCRRSGFAVFQAFERDNNAIGLLSRTLNNSGRKQRTRAEYSRHRFGNLKVLHRKPRDLFGRALTECITHNTDSIEYIVWLMAFYLHVGPFSREVIGRIENMMAALDPSATHTTSSTIRDHRVTSE